MNPRGKSYDAYDKTKQMLKLTNSYYHTKNLDLIKNRRPEYTSRKKEKLMHKSKYCDPINEFFIKKTNEAYTNKIKDLRWKKPKPVINDYFLNKENRLHYFKQQYKNIYDNHCKEENEKFMRRIYNQKAFLSTKVLDKEFKESHIRALKKLKKFSTNDDIILPMVKNRQYRTSENKKKKRKEDESKSGSGDGDENESGSGSGSGSDSANED